MSAAGKTIDMLREKVQSLLQASFVTPEERAEFSARLASLSEQELTDLVEDFEARARFAVTLASIRPSEYAFTADDLAELTQEQLYDDDTMRALMKDGVAVIAYYDGRHAKRIATTLERLLAHPFSDQHKEQETPYRSLIGRLRYMALPLYALEEEVIAVFEKSLADAVRDSTIPLEERVRNRMLTVWFTKRDILKERLRNVMIRNNELLTKKDIRTIDGEERSPTIRNWIRDYIAAVGIGSVDTEKKVQYFTASTNTTTLSSEEKESVRRLLKLYHFLRMSSLTPEGLEESPIVYDPRNGLPTDFDKGGFLPLINSENTWNQTGIIQRSLPQTSRLPQQVIRDPLVASRHSGIIRSPGVLSSPVVIHEIQGLDIKKEQQQLRALQKDNVVLFFGLLFPPQGMKGATQDELLAGLMLLAEDNALEKTLTDPKVKELFVAHLKTKQAPDLLEGFRLAPAMPKYIILFLQWIMQDKAGLSEHDAAQFAVQLVNILKKHGNEKYSRIVYYDAQTKQFMWS